MTEENTRNRTKLMYTSSKIEKNLSKNTDIICTQTNSTKKSKDLQNNIKIQTENLYDKKRQLKKNNSNVLIYLSYF